MVLSQTAEYAMRAVVWLAGHSGNGLCTTQQIAEHTRIPAGYLAKILQSLSRAGIVRSQRGLGGGFRLARSADQISVFEVLQAVDPIQRIQRCPLDVEDHQDLCPLHRRLDQAIAHVEQAFRECSIGELLGELESGPLCPPRPPKDSTLVDLTVDRPTPPDPEPCAEQEDTPDEC